MNSAIKDANDKYEDDNFIIQSRDDAKRHVDRLRAATAKRLNLTLEEATRKQRYPKAFKVALIEAINTNVITSSDAQLAGLNSSTLHNWKHSFKALTGVPLKPNVNFPIQKINPLDKRIAFFKSEVERLKKKVHSLEKIRDLGLTEEELKDVLGFNPTLSDSE